MYGDMNYRACFIGLGTMGFPMAMNLIKSGVHLTVYNRTKEKADKLEGAEKLENLSEAFVKSDVVLSMLSDDESLRQVSNEILKVDRKERGIHVSFSTVSPELAKELTEKHKEKGIHFIAAPVFGRPDDVRDKLLWIVQAGHLEAKKEVAPLLEFLSQKVYDFGEFPEAAAAVNLAGNFLILSVIESLAEAFAFSLKNKIDLRSFEAFLTESIFPSPIYKTYGNMIINQNFEPAGFKMELGMKDINLIMNSAEKHKIPLPLAALLHSRILSSLANGRDEMDCSAIALTVFEEAGLK
jgi:3-hydroxyisobutyrate dehydrogenase-like beta-hydroxyacid dehydrogenase